MKICKKCMCELNSLGCIKGNEDRWDRDYYGLCPGDSDVLYQYVEGPEQEHEPMDTLSLLVWENLGDSAKVTPARKRQLELLNKGV